MDTPAYLFCRICKWLLILPILTRLYTSVIVWNPEKWTLKETWSTDMSPTTIFTQRHRLRAVRLVHRGLGQGCTRGMGYGRVGGGLYRYPTRTPPGPIFSLYLAQRPYLRPNEGLFSTFDEVSEIGSRKGPQMTSELTQNDLRYDPRIDPPDWSRDGPDP